MGQLESDLKSVTETIDRPSGETGKLQAISIEVGDIKSVLGRSSGETSGKLQALSIEVDETKSLINELQAFTQKRRHRATCLFLQLALLLWPQYSQFASLAEPYEAVVSRQQLLG